MDPRTDSLYAGLAGCELPCDEYDLGHGVILRKTFAHFMAPFLMAFAPAPPGKPHPGPWSAVSGGFAFDITTELLVPATFQPPILDRLNIVWWIAALM